MKMKITDFRGIHGHHIEKVHLGIFEAIIDDTIIKSTLLLSNVGFHYTKMIMGFGKFDSTSQAISWIIILTNSFRSSRVAFSQLACRSSQDEFHPLTGRRS